MSTPNFISPTSLVQTLSQRYDLIPASEFAEGWPYAEAGGRILAHIETLEADAREAHSAARVLGCTVADLADRAKEQHRILTETAKALGVSITNVLSSRVSALVRNEAMLADKLGERHALLTRCLELLGQPDADSYDVVPDLIEGLLAKLPSATAPDAVWPDAMTRFLREIHSLLSDRHLAINNELTPENILKRLRWLVGLELSQKEAAQRLHRLVLDCAVAMDLGSASVLEQIPVAVKDLYEDYQRAHRERNEAGGDVQHRHLLRQCAATMGRPADAPFEGIPAAVENLMAVAAQVRPMATTLQAITESLPAELRYTEDIAGAVRQLVLTAETRYGQWSQLREETAPQKQIVGILRELLEDSKPLCIALACELYSTDTSLLELLETLPTERLSATLMESLAVPHDQPIPTTPPTPHAKALEGLCSVAFYRHPMTPGRLEAIGGPLLRFRPFRGGGEVIVNCDRKDLEVYPLDPSDLSPEKARLAGIRVPTPARNPADPYTLDPKVYAANPHISQDELEYAVAKTSGQPPKPSLNPADDDIPF